MAGADFKLTLFPPKVNALTSAVTQRAAKKAADKTVERVKANITASGRVRTGAMRDSIKATKVSGSATKTVYRIGSNKPYTSFQEEGIGPVQARAGGVLRFAPKGMSSFIFRPRTRGFSGAHFLRKALKSARVSDFT